MKKTLLFYINIIAILILNSCATVINGSYQKVYVNSEPQGAMVYLNNRNTNKITPCSIKVKRKQNKGDEFRAKRKKEIELTFYKEGYERKTIKSKRRLCGFSTVSDGLIGLLGATGIVYGYPVTLMGFMPVDFITGAIYRYDKDYNCQLQKLETEKTAPVITILSPDISRGFKLIEHTDQVDIKGSVYDKSGKPKVIINGEEVNVDGQGKFYLSYNLKDGDNKITVVAVDKYNNEAIKEFLVEKREEVVEAEYAYTSIEENLKDKTYHALIVGNNNYKDPNIISLNEPISDASRLYEVLIDLYSFEEENVTFLKNATYEQIIMALDKLSNKLTNKDNLLVFYAGHGWWDDTKNLGYWLPVDAKKDNTAFWIANSRISDYMSSIKSKHTLLIADACFSGSIFKTRSAFADAQPAINKLYELSSKKAMTSGNLKTVPDKSVFLEYLVKRLKENNNKYIASDVLFSSFRQAVLNNSPNEPQYGTIQNAGDEGGEFIFVKKVNTRGSYSNYSKTELEIMKKKAIEEENYEKAAEIKKELDAREND